MSLDPLPPSPPSSLRTSPAKLRRLRSFGAGRPSTAPSLGVPPVPPLPVLLSRPGTRSNDEAHQYVHEKNGQRLVSLPLTPRASPLRETCFPTRSLGTQDWEVPPPKQRVRARGMATHSGKSDIVTTWTADSPDVEDVDWTLEGVELWNLLPTPVPVVAPVPLPVANESVLHRLSRIRSAGSIRPSSAPSPSPSNSSAASGRLFQRSREDMHMVQKGPGTAFPGSGSGAWTAGKVVIRKGGREVLMEVVDKSADPLPTRQLKLHSLPSTSVRTVHRSLFSKPHIIAIYPPLAVATNAPSPTYPSPTTPTPSSPISPFSNQPIYIAFTHPSPASTFLALCRALTKPELRGLSVPGAREAGGLWRSCRKVGFQLLGVELPQLGSTSSGKGQPAPEMQAQVAPQDVRVLVTVNEGPCALLAGPWPSAVVLDMGDVPRVERLGLEVFARSREEGGKKDRERENAGDKLWGKDKSREKEKDTEIFWWKDERWACVGRVELSGVGRNRWVEERWALEGPTNGSGSVRARVRIDDVHVLPWIEYAPLHEYLSHPQTSLPDLFLRLRPLPGLNTLTQDTLGPLGCASGKVWRDLARAVRSEVTNCSPSHTGALFRSNNGLLGAVAAAFRTVGSGWLHDAVGGVVRDVVKEGRGLEGGREFVKEDKERVALWAGKMWEGILKAEEGCPGEIRHFLSIVRTSISSKFGDTEPALELKIVAFFVLFAFLLKGVGSPVQFGIVDAPLEDGVREMLMLLGKMVHGLSLFNSEFKEEKLQPLNSFLSTHHDSARAFLTAISSSSTPKPLPYSPALAHTGDSLAALERTLSPLHGQSVPIPARPRDLPREYALLAATITAAARDRMSDPPVTPSALTAGVPLHRPATSESVTGIICPPAGAGAAAKPPPPEWEMLKSRCLAVQRQIDARSRKVAKESRRGTSASGTGRPITPGTSEGPPRSAGGGYHLPTRLGGGGYDENVPPVQRSSAEDREGVALSLSIPASGASQDSQSKLPATMVSVPREGGRVLVPIENRSPGLSPVHRVLFEKHAHLPLQGDAGISPGGKRSKKEAVVEPEDPPPRRRHKTEPSCPVTTTPVKTTLRGAFMFAGIGELEPADPADVSVPDPQAQAQEVKKRPSRGFLSRLTGRG